MLTYQVADFTYLYTSFHGEPYVYDRVFASLEASDALVIKTCIDIISMESR